MKIPPRLRIDRIEISPVEYIDPTRPPVGFEANSFLIGQESPIGGGFGMNPDEAKTIAIAETVERYLIARSFKNPELTESFDLSSDPTSNGFAFHSQAQLAAENALSEAFERAFRYYCINQGYPSKEVFLPQVITDDILYRTVSTNFDQIRWFQHTDSVILTGGLAIDMTCYICVAKKQNGYYIGASAAPISKQHLSLINHCLIEAWRNLRITQLSPTEQDQSTRHRIRRVAHCQTSIALNSIQKQIPQFNLTHFFVARMEDADGYLARAKFDVPSWSSIPVEEAI